MSVLLDTHVLLWATITPEKLSARCKAILADESETFLVSAASAWEIATKVRLGKLPEAEQLAQEFLLIPKRTGFVLLPIEVSTALRAGRLQGKHGDPFDRMLAAQALDLDVAILSADEKLDQFKVRRIW